MGQGITKSKLFPGNPSYLIEENYKRRNYPKYQNPDFLETYDYPEFYPNRNYYQDDFIQPPIHGKYPQVYYEERGRS